MKHVATFGEVMMRLSPPGFLRFAQAMPGRLLATFAGAEANVAVSIAWLGGKARFVTALPTGDLGDACLRALRAHGVDTRCVIRRQQGRLGIFFVETGANQRPSRVIYDRQDSAVALAGAKVYDWDAVFENADWLHVTGITPAISRAAAEAAIEAVSRARPAGLAVSCDLNFRKKLWQWDPAVKPLELARATMAKVLPHVDVVIANEQDAEDVLDIRAAQTDVEAGKVAVDQYPQVAQQIVQRYEQVSHVAVTLRESLSATHNRWGAMLYDAQNEAAHFAPLDDGQYRPYEITSIVDRVGGGDAFAAALIFALRRPEGTRAWQKPENAVRFAAAASCLAHSIEGDFNLIRREEVEALAGGAASGRVVR